MDEQQVHPHDHNVSPQPESWTGRTDLSFAQQDEREEMLREAVADGLRVVSVLLKRGVALEDVEDEFRKIDPSFPADLFNEDGKAAIEREARLSELDRELKHYRRVYHAMTTFAEVFWRTVSQVSCDLAEQRDYPERF